MADRPTPVEVICEVTLGWSLECGGSGRATVMEGVKVMWEGIVESVVKKVGLAASSVKCSSWARIVIKESIKGLHGSYSPDVT